MKKHIFFSPALFLLSSLFLIASALVIPQTALAGFQWVAPADTGAQTPAPGGAVSSAPQQPVQSSPLVIMGPASQPAPAESTHTLTPKPALTTPAVPEKAVQGFANNVPLAVALRQILPPDYGFSVAQDVNLSTLVSWRGGAPWHQTLQDMLGSVGLAMHEQGQMISIVRGSDIAKSGASAVAPGLQPNENPPTSLSKSTNEHVLQLPPSMMPPPAAPPIQPQIQETSSIDTWTANRGDTLRQVLENWCRRANVEMSWQAEYDYPLQASVALTGSFEDVVRSLLSGFQEAQPQPIAFLHNNQIAGQTVLVIQTRGNNYSD